MPITPADRLRARATALRTLARRLQHLEALTLASRASDRTWVGPSPYACEQSLRGRRRQLLDHVDLLLSTARDLERQAIELR
ncbi:MAG: hypothetical protein HY828_06595 [Actinobacteria bacterium]|nr:hypothetical protein [Actinomycetota bacterium]